MSNRHKTVISNSHPPFEDQNHDDIHQIEKETESIQEQTSVEPNPYPIENIQQNPMKLQKSSYPSIFTEQKRNPSSVMKEEFFDVFALDRTQSEKGRLKL